MNKQTPITEVQGYRDPYTQFKKGTVKEDVFEQIQRKKAEAAVVAAEQVGATKAQKKKAAKDVIKTKIVNKIKQRTLVKDKPVSELQIESSYPKLVDPVDVGIDPADAQQTETEMAADARRFAQEWNEGDSRTRAAKDITKLTEVPNIRFGGWGNEIPGSGAVVSSFTRALMNGAASVVNEFGTILQDAGAAQQAAFERNKAAAPELFGDQEFQPVSPVGELGAWMSSLGQDAAKTMEQVGKKKSDQSIGERIAGFAGEMGAQLPSMLAITEAAGPTVGFGLMKVIGARAKGETDPLKLGAEFVLGAIGEHVFKELGKTSQWIDDVIGVETTAGRYFATGTQLTAQGIGGVVQEGIDAGLHPEQMGQRDWLDYTFAGLSNVILDPLLLPGGSKKAQGSVETMRRKFEGVNLDLPAIGKKDLRAEYFYGDVPIENLTVKTLMDNAKIQFDETGDVMWVNPSAGVVLSRAADALGKWKIEDTDQGVVLSATQAKDLANLLDQKSIQIKNLIAEMGEPDAEARDLVTMAIQYEAMAEHLMYAADGKETLKVRFGGANTTENIDKTVIGHEALHEEQIKIANKGGTNLYDLTDPTFLLSHPLGAKVISLNKDYLEKNYPDSRTWTAEVIAQTAQPGNAGLGLTKQERGVLLGDYLADVGKKQGVSALANFDAKWVDRDVARNALNRLAQRNFVELKRGNEGLPVGLIWKQGEDWPMTRSGEGSWKGMEIQPPRMVGKREDVNKAVKLNDLMWRLKGSKAIHGDGELIRVYHGSPKGLEIKEVDFDKLNKNDWIKGFFTTQSAEVASGYAGNGGFGTVKLENQGRNVHAFYLDIRNPLDLDATFELIDIRTKEEKLQLRQLQDIRQVYSQQMLQKYGLGYVVRFEQGRGEPQDIEQWKAYLAKEDELTKLTLDKFTHPILESARKFGVPEKAINEATDVGTFNEFIGELTRQIKANSDAFIKDTPELQAAFEKKRLVMAEHQALIEQADTIAQAVAMGDPDLSDRLTEVRILRDKKEAEFYLVQKELQEIYETVVPSDFAIDKVRAILLAAGYDGATHLGGEGRGKEFTDKVEAERYAKETGGEFEEQSRSLTIEEKENLLDEFRPSLPANFTDGLEALQYYRSANNQGWELSDIEAIEYLGINRDAGVERAMRSYIQENHPELLAGFDAAHSTAKSVYKLISEAQLNAKVYEVNGHKVWIAFKPEQVISATDLLPVTESYFGADLENYKIDNWKEKLDKLRADNKVEPLALNEIEQIFTQMNSEAGMNSLMENLPLPKSVEEGFGAGDPVDPKGDAGATVEDADNATRYQAIYEEYKLSSAKLAADNRNIRDLGKTLRELKKLADSGTDVKESWQATQKLLETAKQEKDKSFRYNQVIIQELRSRWIKVAEDARKQQISDAAQEYSEKAAEFIKNQRRAQERLNNPDLVDNFKDASYRDVMRLKDFAKITNVAMDVLKAANIEVLPKEERSFHRQLMDAITGGNVNLDQLDTALAPHNLTIAKVVDAFLYAGSEAGKIMQVLSAAKKDLNKFKAGAPEALSAHLDKLFTEIPQLELWVKTNVPTMNEIRSLVKGRNNIMRFINIHNGAMLLNPATQMTNFTISTANLAGQGLLNFMENLELRIMGGEYDVKQLDGSVVKKSFEKVPLSDSFRPLIELASVLNHVRHLDTIGWIDEGVKPVGRPNDRVNRAIELVDKIAEIFPDVQKDLLASMSADIESMDIPVMEKTLDTMRRQIELMPEGAIRDKKLSEIAKQQIKLKQEGGKIAEKLRAGEAVMHKLMVIGRGPERMLRTAAFAGQLEFYAKRYGQDVVKMLEEGKLHEVNPDAVKRAVNDALTITYGKQPEKNASGFSYYAYLQWLRRGESKLAIAANLIQPFQNFMVQATRQIYEWSPAKLLSYVFTAKSAWGSRADGDFSGINKALVGTLAWTFAYGKVKAKYDEAEEKNLPPEHPQWDAFGSLSLKGTPWGAMFYVADVVERHRRGLAIDGNLLKAAQELGADFRGIGGMFEFMDNFYEKFAKGDESWGDKAVDAASLAVGNWFSGFATPLRSLTDFTAMFDEDQRTLKDIYGWGYGGLVLPTLDKLPSSFSMFGGQKISARELLSDRIDPYTGRPMMRNVPAMKALTGFNLVPEQSAVGKLMTYHGVKYGDWIPYSGINEVDRELTRKVGQYAAILNKDFEDGKMEGVDLDEQVNIAIQALKEYSADALDEVLINFPDVRLKMEVEDELNKWERRVIDKAQKKAGQKSFDEIYKEKKQERLNIRKAVGVENIGN